VAFSDTRYVDASEPLRSQEPGPPKPRHTNIRRDRAQIVGTSPSFPDRTPHRYRTAPHRTAPGRTTPHCSVPIRSIRSRRTTPPPAPVVNGYLVIRGAGHRHTESTPIVWLRIRARRTRTHSYSTQTRPRRRIFCRRCGADFVMRTSFKMYTIPCHGVTDRTSTLLTTNVLGETPQAAVFLRILRILRILRDA
jgi:hypothetical protein